MGKNVGVIVMFTSWIESGKPKADLYFNLGIGKSVTFGTDKPISIRTISMENIRNQEWLRVTEFEITYKGRRKTVQYIHYRQWTDMSVPTEEGFSLLLKTYSDMKQAHDKAVGFRSRALVHCSAGIGRAGTFVATCLLIKQINSIVKKYYELSSQDSLRIFGTESIDIIETISYLRTKRVGIVQRECQLEFIYRFLSHYLKLCASDPREARMILNFQI